LTLKRGRTDPRYFQAQTTGSVNFPWLPEPADMPVTTPSIKVVDVALPGNDFGVPDIYVVESEKDEEADRLFLDSDGDYGEETCEDSVLRVHVYIHFIIYAYKCVYIYPC
jgi:hypothetical protein